AGRQRFTSDEFHADVVYVENAVYLRGNGDLVTALLDLPQSSAASVDDTWIVIRPSDAVFDDAVDGMTLASALDDMEPEAPLAKAGPLEVKGEPMMRVSGEERGALFVSVRTGLPV